MTFAYVITSTSRDHVTEQAMMSMHSLRMYNPDAHITLVTDRDTLKGLVGNRGRIREYVNEFVSPEIPGRMNAFQRSRFIKTSLRKHIKGDFLFLDSDTLVTDSLSEIQSLPYDVAQTLNMHRADYTANNPDAMVHNYKKITGRDIVRGTNITQYFNSGVIFSRDTEAAHRFFDRWHQLWLKDSSELNFHKDQISNWTANSLLGNVIKELDPIYNCQFVYPVYALKYFDSAKILHYFSSTALAGFLKVKDHDFLKKIAKRGIDEEAEAFIKNIKPIFIESLHQITDSALRKHSSGKPPKIKAAAWHIAGRLRELVPTIKRKRK